jgi:hypothetical protein
VAGYREIWVSRLDGDELSLEEIDELDRVVSADIWFDSGEDDVSIIFDPDTYAGALAITVYEQTEDTPGTAATEA